MKRRNATHRLAEAAFALAVLVIALSLNEALKSHGWLWWVFPRNW